MPNLKEIRTRISSVSSTKKITSAMKMVSAAKFKKAQNNLIKFRPFNEKISNLIDQLTSSKDSDIVNYIGWRKDIKNVAILVITSNNSMCGAFNSSIIKKALQTYEAIKAENSKANITFYCIGKKAEDVLKRGKRNLKSFDHVVIDKPKVEYTKSVFDELFQSYNCGKLDRIEIVYNRFKNAASQIQVSETLLPIINNSNTKDKTAYSKYIVEPSSDVLLKKLLPYYLLNKLHSALLESSAAEHGARMTAMHQATENATSLLNSLVLEYNKARQAAITKEILEIVSGANALNE